MEYFGGIRMNLLLEEITKDELKQFKLDINEKGIAYRYAMPFSMLFF